jgi:hypothetical protein
MPRFRMFAIKFAVVLICGTLSHRVIAQIAADSAAPDDQVKKAHAAEAATQEGKTAADTTNKKAAQAASGGIALKGTTNVKDYVNIQVVLLARKQAEKVFSKEIARQYAVVQVIIDNKSEDAAFVLHSIFADYAGWALSGVPSPVEVTGGSPSSGELCTQARDNSKANDYQTVSCAGQVASIESRVIRSELQGASVWNWRNGVVRAAILVGAVASGIPAFGSKNAVKYVGAYNGQLVPGMEVFWPDGTVPQLNNVSDYGFQTNKIFAKGHSDPVYAFFPLDRFFTPGMKNIFLNAPAVFFAPAQIFVDRHVGKNSCWKPGICIRQSDVDEMKNLIEDLLPTTIPSLCSRRDQDNAASRGQVGTVTSIGASGGIVTLAVANTMKKGDAVTLAGLTNNAALNTGGTSNASRVILTAATPTTVSFASTETITPGSETGTITSTANACFTQKQRDHAMLRLLTMPCPAKETGDAKIDNEKACKTTLVARDLVNEISLNSTNVLVQGVMTVNVATVPATITGITFDEGNDSPDVWTVLNKDHAATTTGSFLTGGVTEVTSIEVPTAQSAKIADYLDPTKISLVSDSSTDTKLNFKIQWKKEIPPGSKLHFQVTKYDPKDTKKTSGVKSMDFVLPVDYNGKIAATDTKPGISKVNFDKEDAAATWAAGGTLAGKISGSSLGSATPNISKINVPSDKSASVDRYVDTTKLVTDKSKSNDSELRFTASLKKRVPSGSTITFTVTGNNAKGTAVTSDPKDYSVNYK